MYCICGSTMQCGTIFSQPLHENCYRLSTAIVTKVSEHRQTGFCTRQVAAPCSGRTARFSLPDPTGNYMHILLSLSLHCYLLYLNSCDGNDATPATERGEEYHKMSSTKLLINGKSGCVHAWRWMDITLNIWLNKISSFQSHQQSTEETRYVLHHFRRRHLTTNEVSRSEETRKVKYALIFEGVLMPFT